MRTEVERAEVHAMKGILLAGGSGTRLYPITAVTSKQLVPVYNKPMIYYSLTTLMLAGIREILLIASPRELPNFRTLLDNGSQWGIELSYELQGEPRGIAEALIIGEGFASSDPVMLMLGDNLVYGRFDFLREAIADRADDEAVIFAYQVGNPSEYGVVVLDEGGSPVGLEEKPSSPKSRWAVPGFYLYPPGASKLAATLSPSARGELEITDLNKLFLASRRLAVKRIGRGIAWLDTGTPESLLAAASFIEAVETRQGLLVGSPEEAAFRMGFIDERQLAPLAAQLPPSSYRTYLEWLVDGQGSE